MNQRSLWLLYTSSFLNVLKNISRRGMETSEAPPETEFENH